MRIWLLCVTTRSMVDAKSSGRWFAFNCGACSTVQNKQSCRLLFALALIVQHGDLCAFEMESMTDVTKHVFTWRTIHNLIAVGHVVQAHIRTSVGRMDPYRPPFNVTQCHRLLHGLLAYLWLPISDVQ